MLSSVLCSYSIERAARHHRQCSRWMHINEGREADSQADSQSGRQANRMGTHTRASLACSPKHNLTAHPLKLHSPLWEQSKQTWGGVLFTDSQSQWIKSISSLTSKRERNAPWIQWTNLRGWRRTGQSCGCNHRKLRYPSRRVPSIKMQICLDSKNALIWTKREESGTVCMHVCGAHGNESRNDSECKHKS